MKTGIVRYGWVIGIESAQRMGGMQMEKQAKGCFEMKPER